MWFIINIGFYVKFVENITLLNDAKIIVLKICRNTFVKRYVFYI
jgi:hypothetical protein